MAYLSAGLFVLVSLAMLPIGLFLLAKARRWVALTLLVAYLIGYPLLLAAIFQISDKHLGIWVLAVVLPLGIGWIAAGPVVYGIAQRAPSEWFGENAKPPSPRIQMRGFIVFIIGAIAWVIGAFSPDLSKGLELLMLAIALYGLLLGGYWLLGRA